MHARRSTAHAAPETLWSPHPLVHDTRRNRLFFLGGGLYGPVEVSALDLASGKLTAAGVVEGVANPSFLALHPSGRFLYAVSEVSDSGGKKTGAVSAFAVERATGALGRRRLMQNEQGAGPERDRHQQRDNDACP